MNNEINEDEYCSEDSQFKFKKNFFIVSGCSGSGKSTLIHELSKSGFRIIHEAGRQIVKEQNYISGDALPWKDWMKFIELTISRTIHNYDSMIREEEIVFFDRGIIDQVSWEHPDITVPKHLMNAALKYRFNEVVFITPPWPEIYVIDKERKHSYDEALAGYESTIKMYNRLGYKIVYVPKIEQAARADFVIYFVKQLNFET